MGGCSGGVIKFSGILMAMLRRVLLFTTTGAFQCVNGSKAEKGCSRQH